MLHVFDWAIKRAKTINQTVCEGIKEYFCRSGRRFRLKGKLLARIESHLDLRNIVES